MQSVKNINKKFSGFLSKRELQSNGSEQGADSPDANAGRAVRLFCESGSASNPGEEVLHLPVIVENAESSPQAAAAAAYQIRKFLGRDNYNKPHVQYNAIMLIGILTDNPGPSFTKNCDKKFVVAIKDLLRDGTDPSVQQILRETLDRLEVDKAYDRNLEPIFSMWRKEKGVGASFAGGRPIPRTMNAPPFDPNGAPPGQAYGNGGSHYARNHGQQRGLPPPVELAGRIEEARTSAKLLQQLVQSTPADEVLSNDLIKEFAERCQSAQRSVQGYINCDSPPPDDNTLQTLIETNELLSLATSKHQRAILNARRATPSRGTSPYQPPPSQNGFPSTSNVPQLPAIASPSISAATDDNDDSTDVSYAAPTRRPTYPPPTSAPPPQAPIANPYPQSDRYHNNNNNNNATNNNNSSSGAAATAGTNPSAATRLRSRSRDDYYSDASALGGTSSSSVAPIELPTPATYASDGGNPFSDAHSTGAAPPHPLEPMHYGASSVVAGGAPGGGGRPAQQQEALGYARTGGKGMARGALRRREEEEEDGEEADDEGGSLGRDGVRGSVSVSSGISPLETRPMAFRY